MNNLTDIERSLNIVTALEITETRYKDLTIQMCEIEHDVYTVRILDESGVLIHTMTDIPHWEEADMWATGFIDGYILARNRK